MAYRDEVMADNPLGYWRLNEASGTVAADTSGNGRTGTYTGTVLFGQAGPITGETADKAIYVDAAAPGRVVIPAHASLDTGSGPVTLEAWVLQAAGAPTGPILEFGDASTYGVHMWVHPTGNDLWLNPANVALTNPGLAGVGSLTTHLAWYHCVFTYDGSGTAFLYVNGSQVATASISGPLKTGAQNLYIGHRPMSGGAHFTGRIDEVAIYGTALSPTRIAAHYAARTVQGILRWDGSAWVPAITRRWNGSAWVATVPKRWNGSAWV